MTNIKSTRKVAKTAASSRSKRNVTAPTRYGFDVEPSAMIRKRVMQRPMPSSSSRGPQRTSKAATKTGSANRFSSNSITPIDLGPSVMTKGPLNIRESPPLKQESSAIKKEVPSIKKESSVKKESPVRKESPIKKETPIKSESPIKQESPIKNEKSVKKESPPSKKASPSSRRTDTPRSLGSAPMDLESSPSNASRKSSLKSSATRNSSARSAKSVKIKTPIFNVPTPSYYRYTPDIPIKQESPNSQHSSSSSSYKSGPQDSPRPPARGPRSPGNSGAAIAVMVANDQTSPMSNQRSPKNSRKRSRSSSSGSIEKPPAKKPKINPATPESKVSKKPCPASAAAAISPRNPDQLFREDRNKFRGINTSGSHWGIKYASRKLTPGSAWKLWCDRYGLQDCGCLPDHGKPGACDVSANVWLVRWRMIYAGVDKGAYEFMPPRHGKRLS